MSTNCCDKTRDIPIQNNWNPKAAMQQRLRATIKIFIISQAGCKELFYLSFDSASDYGSLLPRVHKT